MTCRQHRNLPPAHNSVTPRGEPRRFDDGNPGSPVRSGALINPQAPWGINQEAPLDGLNDHWEPPETFWQWYWKVMRPAVKLAAVLIGIIAVIAVALFGWALLAHAHMLDRPDLDAWFNSLQGAGGMPCCSQVDGSTVADPDWDTTVVDGKSHYRVRVGGEWIVVTDAEVVEGPNKYGRPLVWVYHIDGKPQIRCFLPGSGT